MKKCGPFIVFFECHPYQSSIKKPLLKIAFFLIWTLYLCVMEQPLNFDWTVMLNEYWICKLGARTCMQYYTCCCLHDAESQTDA